MTHYDLLGLSPEASEGEVREALAASRASWERRRDAAADAGARSRAEGALTRLAEAERALLAPEPVPPKSEPMADAERAIRAEAERRREAARQENERAQREAAEIPRADEAIPAREFPAREFPERPRSSKPPIKSRPRKAESRAGSRQRTLLILATTFGIGLAGAPVVLVAFNGNWPWQAPASTAPPDVFPMRGGHGAPVEVVLVPTPLPATVDALVAAVPLPSPRGAADLLRMAHAAYGAHRYKESLAINDQVLARIPTDPIARVHRSLTLLALNRAHDAEVECRIAIKIMPTLPEAHYNLGVALHRQGRNAEAVAAFKKFVDLAPSDKGAPAARGFIARSILGQKRIGGAWAGPASKSVR